MRGKPQAAYKRIQRFLRRVDPRQALADVTEVECPQARKPPPMEVSFRRPRHGAAGFCCCPPRIGGEPSLAGSLAPLLGQ
jgi:hypothetical protein